MTSSTSYYMHCLDEKQPIVTHTHTFWESYAYFTMENYHLFYCGLHTLRYFPNHNLMFILNEMFSPTLFLFWGTQQPRPIIPPTKYNEDLPDLSYYNILQIEEKNTKTKTLCDKVCKYLVSDCWFSLWTHIRLVKLTRVQYNRYIYN